VTRDEFIARFGWVFEDSPWVAERAWERGPFASNKELHAAMVDVVGCATREEQLALLRAHPDLGARARMSEASVDEQAGAGLDRLTPAEYQQLQSHNALYRQKFGFPFLLAVKGSTKHDILKALERRLNAAPEDEFQEALSQVYRIAGFRLETALP
jgi:2-oxo-4-hydroxy-4-carboxy-5-ureidoimidazoline decarboxylase